MTAQHSSFEIQPAEAGSRPGRRLWHAPQMVDLTIAIETHASSGAPSDGDWESAT